MNLKSRKLLLTVNVDWFLISHRLCIAEQAVKEGWDVYVLGEDTGRSKEIESKGITFINLPFSRSGTNPINEFKTLYSFYKIYNKIKPNVVHHITLKPVIYGSVVSKLLRIHGTLNAISGLGYNFTGDRQSLVQKCMVRLMKFGFNQKNLGVIFQNKDDHNEIDKLEILSNANDLFFIKGSGVDLNDFKHSPFPKTTVVKILLPTRMLWDKGVKEFRAVTDILKHEFKGKVLFVLSGLADTENKAGVTESYLKDWEEEGYVEWIGYQKNMVEIYQDSHIVVLPSYREGMPKSLIEACAIGRPIVTTDAIGCRECVDEGVNGFKVPVKSINELAKAIEKLILDENLRVQMGIKSRLKAEKEFAQQMVVDKHLEIYNKLNEC